MASIWDNFAPLAAILGGSYLTTQANQAAAERASAATLEGARINAKAIREGNAQAQQTLASIRAEGAPGVSYLRRVVAEPGELTPLQQQQLEDSRRSTANTLHSSNFAGSGRTGVELLRRNESDFINQALENNRGRAITAGSQLASAGMGAATGIANSQAKTGTDVGKVEGDAFTRSGIYGAQADLASGNVTGKAIGDIGSLIASQNRESRYADRVSRLERLYGING